MERRQRVLQSSGVLDCQFWFRRPIGKGSAFLAYLWSTQCVAAEVQLDVGGYNMLRAIGTKVSQLCVLILEQSIAAAARALAKGMMTDFMDYGVHWIFSGELRSNFGATPS
jgi:hypothetical protein